MELEFKMDFDRIGAFFAILVGMLLLALPTYAIVQSIRSNGEVDYCYLEMWSPPQMAPQYKLYGHRPWRTDRDIGVFPSIDDAKTRADSMNCRINSTK